MPPIAPALPPKAKGVPDAFVVAGDPNEKGLVAVAALAVPNAKGALLLAAVVVAAPNAKAGCTMSGF